MKKLFFFFVVVAGIVLLAFIPRHAADKPDPLASGFIQPPDSIQTSVYWYWVSDNISKEGVVNDLYAMKKAGINRAFIGNIGLKDVAYGKVKMLSEEWWDILHTALKTATDLHIDIGIFNSPGWSQSGGPWVGSQNAMRYLASSELRVKGPIQFSQILDKPIEPFQDVRVIAYPAPKEQLLKITAADATLSSFPRMSDLTALVDGNKKTGIQIPAADSFVIQIDLLKPFVARSISILPTATPILANVQLQMKKNAAPFITVAQFELNRSKPDLNVGFDPYAPLVISFPPDTATAYKLVIKTRKQGAGNSRKEAFPECGIAEVAIQASPRVERFSEKTLAKMHPTPLPYWDAYLWRQQPETKDKERVIDGSRVVDITRYMSADGKLTWQVPPGDWVIVRTGMTPTGTKNGPASPEATGYEVDKMSKEHVEKHFYAHMGEVLKRIPAADRKSFKVVVQDSYEMGGQNFTDDFIAAFTQKYSYDPTPYLPVYNGWVVNSQEASDRFLWDMRRMVADRLAYDYVGGFREVSHQNGLTTWLENYGHWGFPGEFLMYGGQSDEISGEFWSEGTLGDIENRAATSCGHIYGKTKISAESNTCSGKAFSRYPATIKQRGDRFFAEGINNTLLHVFISQPYEDKNPGLNAWFGNEFNRKNTWFSQFDLYTQYLKRTNFMLQQGINVADVAYFIGEDAPKMTGIADPSLPIGYQFDYINAEVIEKYVAVRNGLITLPAGTQYKILVLPKQETMRPELLAKIKSMVQQGAVILGPAPKRSPSLQNQPMADQQVREMAKEIWGNVDGVKVKQGTYGKGIVLNGLTMEQAFGVIHNVPDCQLPKDSTIHFGHRKLAEGDIYFLTNQTSKTQVISPSFRVTGLQPELWEATTGYMRALPSFEQKKNTITVPLQLAPYESVFIVFRKAIHTSTSLNLALNYPSPSSSEDVKGPWKVYFDPQQRGPAAAVVFDELQDWSTAADERIKYYSGTAVYKKTFHVAPVKPGEKLTLDLGMVTAMAKVKLNGEYVGGVWTPPYQLDITQQLKPGDNELEIEVVNTWVNRLIGDSKLPKEERKTWCSVNPYNPSSALQASGLIGPVRIMKK